MQLSNGTTIKFVGASKELQFEGMTLSGYVEAPDGLAQMIDQRIDTVLRAHRDGIEIMCAAFVDEADTHSLVNFQDNGLIAAMVPNEVLEAVARGERTLTSQQALEEFTCVHTRVEKAEL